MFLVDVRKTVCWKYTLLSFKGQFSLLVKKKHTVIKTLLNHEVEHNIDKCLKLAGSIIVQCWCPHLGLFSCVPSLGKACSHYSLWEHGVYAPAVLLTLHFSKCMVLIMNARSPKSKGTGSAHSLCEREWISSVFPGDWRGVCRCFC